MKSIVLGCVFVVICYLIFLVVQTPANFVFSQAKVPPQVVIEKLTGSIWQAEAKQVNYNNLTLHNVEAQLSFLSLLSLQPSVDLQFGKSTVKGPDGELSIAVDGDNIYLSDVNITEKAQSILAYLNLNLPVKAQGSVKLTMSDMHIEKQACIAGNGQIHWSKAQVNAYDENIVLGNLTAKLQCENNNLAVIIDDKNTLGLNYKALFNARGFVRGEGFIQPSANFPEKLKPMLSLLGQPDSEGRYVLKL